jgi:N-terminal conserved domain of Nudc.
LDSVFGFLLRRTDFYYESEPGDKMGFRPGMTESMVYTYFRKYQEVHQKRFPPKPETVKRWEEFEK